MKTFKTIPNYQCTKEVGTRAICFIEGSTAPNTQIYGSYEGIETFFDIGSNSFESIIIIISDPKITREEHLYSQVLGTHTMIYSKTSNTVFRLETLDVINYSTFIFASEKPGIIAQGLFCNFFKRESNNLYCLGKRGTHKPVDGSFVTLNNQKYKTHFCASSDPESLDTTVKCDRSLDGIDYKHIYVPKENNYNIIKNFDHGEVLINLSGFDIKESELKGRQVKSYNPYKPDNIELSFGSTTLVFEGANKLHLSDFIFKHTNDSPKVGRNDTITAEYPQCDFTSQHTNDSPKVCGSDAIILEYHQ